MDLSGAGILSSVHFCCLLHSAASSFSDAFFSFLILQGWCLEPTFSRTPFSVVYWFSLCHDEVRRQEVASAPKQKPLFFSRKSEAKAWPWLTLSFAVASVGAGSGRGEASLLPAALTLQCFPAGPGPVAGAASRFLGGKPVSWQRPFVSFLLPNFSRCFVST